MADLTTVANAKAWMGVKTADDDALIARLISAVSGYIETWTNRRFAQAAYVEGRDGNGGTLLAFADYPVSAVASVTVDGQAIPSAAAVGDVGYRFDETRLWLTGYAFTRGRANVRLAYTAGYASVPPEIEQACLELVALRYKERDRIGHQSKALAGETVAFIVKDMPDSVRTILNNYRKVISL